MDNFKVIGLYIFRVSGALASFTLNIGETANIHFYGYSNAHKQLYIHFSTGKRYIYKDISEFIWAKWRLEITEFTQRTFDNFFSENIKGVCPCEEVQAVDYYLDPSDANQLLKQYDNLLHHMHTTVGLWATDVPEKVSDPEKVLFQITAPFPLATEWNIFAQEGVSNKGYGEAVSFVMAKTLHTADGKYSPITVGGSFFIYEDNQWLQVVGVDRTVPHAHVVTAVPWQQ